MPQVKVKICGVTSVADAVQAAQSGADALGLNFYARSSRYIDDLGLARAICQAVGPFVSTVGLFVDSDSTTVERVLREVPLSMLQFHGNESELECSRFQRPYIKAIRMNPEQSIAESVEQYPSAQGILLDAYVPGVAGGTGRKFDWSNIPQAMSKPLVLAGGLKPDNVQAAVRQVKPWAVDVSGGVESAPGRKDPALVREFIRLAKSTTQSSAFGE